MNERIKELAEQARLGRGPEKIKVVENGVVIFYIDELEKFAELIVKESGVALSPMLRDMVSRGHAYDLIKKHFGIEE